MRLVFGNTPLTRKEIFEATVELLDCRELQSKHMKTDVHGNFPYAMHILKECYERIPPAVLEALKKKGVLIAPNPSFKVIRAENPLVRFKLTQGDLELAQAVLDTLKQVTPIVYKNWL